MIVTVGSIRGAPGATSWALLIGAAWPSEFEQHRVVLEADPAGGVIGARYGLGVDPGVVKFVTGMRRNGSSSIAFEGSSRVIDEHLSVMPGPESGEQSRSVWADSAAEVAQRLRVDDGAWIVDIGRSDESNPCVAFAEASSLAVLVVGPRSEDLVQLPARVDSFRRGGVRVGVLVSGRCPFGASDVQDFASANAAWIVDPRSELIDEVGLLLGGRRARRSWLWRQALEVAAAVAQLAHSPMAAVSPVEGGRR